MLSAIQFDNQLFLKAHKVNDVPSYGLLPAKFMTFEVPIPKMSPKFTFGIC